MHRASLQYLFTNIKDTHLTIGLDSIFSKNIFNCEIKLLKKAIIAIKDTFINNPILVACVMTNYLHKVLPPQYSHVNKVYCLLAVQYFAHFRFAQQKLPQKIFSNTVAQRIFMGMPKHGQPKMNMTVSISE